MRSNCAATARQAKPREMSALLAPNGIALAAQTCQHIMEPPLPSYLCMLAPLPLSLHIAMQRERPFEYAATSFSVRPWPMRIRPVVIVIALVAAVVAAAAAAASAVVVAPSYC